MSPSKFVKVTMCGYCNLTVKSVKLYKDRNYKYFVNTYFLNNVEILYYGQNLRSHLRVINNYYQEGVLLSVQQKQTTAAASTTTRPTTIKLPPRLLPSLSLLLLLPVLPLGILLLPLPHLLSLLLLPLPLKLSQLPHCQYYYY